MKMPAFTTVFTAFLFLAGCASDKGVERGPQGTIGYSVQVESSEPGARIEVNGDYVGVTPTAITIYGDKDGSFHNFGSQDYVIKAYPAKGGFVQTKVFHTGAWFQSQDRIPKRIYFDTSLDAVQPRERIDVNVSK
jgi:hypothetical protein